MSGFLNLPAPPTLESKLFPLTSWLGKVYAILNGAMRGKINATVDVTLTQNSTTTVVTDARLSGSSYINFMAMSDSAKVTLGLGIKVTAQGAGTATLTHDNTADADKNVRLLIIG